MKRWIAATIAVLGLTACAALPPPVPVPPMPEPGDRAELPLRPGNTTLWPGGSPRSEPGLARDGFIASMEQGGSLVILGFDGEVIQSLAAPGLGDIEVAALPLEENYSVLIGGAVRSGRTTRLVFHRLDPGAGQAVRPWGEMVTDLGEPSGFCMRQDGASLRAVGFDRRGQARVYDIAEDEDGALRTREVRRFRVDGARRGCAIDVRTRRIYFSREGGGFAATPLSTDGEVVRLQDPSPRRLPRSLGLSFLTDGPDGYLVSLDEDRAAYSVWNLSRDGLRWLGRFEVRESEAAPALRRLVAVEAYGGALGAFPSGVIIVQGGGRPGLTFVDWAAVKAALGL